MGVRVSIGERFKMIAAEISALGGRLYRIGGIGVDVEAEASSVTVSVASVRRNKCKETMKARKRVS